VPIGVLPDLEARSHRRPVLRQQPPLLVAYPSRVAQGAPVRARAPQRRLQRLAVAAYPRGFPVPLPPADGAATGTVVSTGTDRRSESDSDRQGGAIAVVVVLVPTPGIGRRRGDRRQVAFGRLAAAIQRAVCKEHVLIKSAEVVEESSLKNGCIQVAS
jgi:hypothetical protein